VPRYFALVPAAGSGSRFGKGTPKQYLTLNGEPLLYHALRALAAHRLIDEVFVVLARDDAHFSSVASETLGRKIRPLFCGGETRAASVHNGLMAVREAVANDDWVLVHDAARPCLSARALDRLMHEVAADEAGGLLAIPVADTLKRSDGQDRVLATIRRESLWQAQTPQMFRYSVLCAALDLCGPSSVTDEAGAVEKLGLKPKLVMGEAQNLKVTYPEDLELAARILVNAWSSEQEGAATRDKSQ
jgi:2-C-methyl-D-erythritol 4-phosphate cytidylyltransferase